jgi:hypothetical protein
MKKKKEEEEEGEEEEVLTLQSMREGQWTQNIKIIFCLSMGSEVTLPPDIFKPHITKASEAHWWILTFSFCEVVPRRA